jgi:hypothetical protein
MSVPGTEGVARWPTRYRVVVDGELSERFAEIFEGWTATTSPGLTFLEGEVTDQAELDGLLEHLRALGLGLVSVSPLGEGVERRT